MTRIKKEQLLFFKNYKVTIELCTRMNPSWPKMALSQLYVPPGYDNTHTNKHTHTHTHTNTYVHTVLQNGAKKRAHTHTQKQHRAQAHTNIYTQLKQTSSDRCPVDKGIFPDLFFHRFDYLTFSSWHDFAVQQFTLHVHGSGSTQLSYQRGRGSTRVNRKFSQ